ncbi:hypothetical protein FRX31_016185, partial [Thalictrum thalictroides]
MFLDAKIIVGYVLTHSGNVKAMVDSCATHSFISKFTAALLTIKLHHDPSYIKVGNHDPVGIV